MNKNFVEIARGDLFKQLSEQEIEQINAKFKRSSIFYYLYSQHKLKFHEFILKQTRQITSYIEGFVKGQSDQNLLKYSIKRSSAPSLLEVINRTSDEMKKRCVLLRNDSNETNCMKSAKISAVEFYKNYFTLLQKELSKQPITKQFLSKLEKSYLDFKKYSTQYVLGNFKATYYHPISQLLLTLQTN